MTETPSSTPEPFEVLVVGGGAAGLSAALTLARARRRVLVVDAGRQRNRPAAGVHGFLTRDGVAPAEFLAAGRAEVERYDGIVRHAEVTGLERTTDGFVATLHDGSIVTALRAVVTTGLVDELPDIAGLAQRWGRDVVHCPYCHGYEIRDQAVGVVATTALSVHQALLFRQWSEDLVFFTDAVTLDPADRERLVARGVRIVDGAVVALEVRDDRLTGVRLADGTVVARQAVAVATRMVARGGLLAGLGLAPVPHPMGATIADQIPTVDAFGRTAVPGLWVARNVTDPAAQVVSAAAQGVMAGAQVNADLVTAEADAAVAALGRAAVAARNHVA